MAFTCSGSIFVTERGSGRETAFHSLPSKISLTRFGLNNVPPLAIDVANIARAIGVTATAPCPMDTEIVSPGYHLPSLRVFFAHSLDAMKLGPSFGRSMPVRPTKPKRSAHL